MSSRWDRKSKRASSKWTRSSAESDCPSKPPIILKSNCAKKWSPSIRSGPAKTWSVWKKLSPPPSRKNIAPGNREKRARKQPTQRNQSASRRKNKGRLFFSPATNTLSKIKPELHANPVFSVEVCVENHRISALGVCDSRLRE